MRIRVRYVGRVQGVGFRATCRGIAARTAVTGWVRNEEDGSVLMEVQGEIEDVQKVIGEIGRVMGRFIVRIDEVEIGEAADERGFEVRR